MLTSEMKSFLPYVLHLEELVRMGPHGVAGWRHRTSLALDGEPGRELAKAVDLETRRKTGAFFTGKDLARTALGTRRQTRGRTFYFDPACGAGDLLLAAARHLPIRGSLQSTLELWSTALAGCDAYAEFVRATKARLVLLALLRHASIDHNDGLDLKSLFPLINVRDGLKPSHFYSNAQWIILNPPYGYMGAPKACTWASGNVTAAGVFFEVCLQNSATGTRVTAILPEVLRSGTRYEKWRQLVVEQSNIKRLQPYGLFDRRADVDVFILDVVKQSVAKQARKISWTTLNHQRGKSVGDMFTVHIGPVVPHRHRKVGTFAPYIHARAVTPWGSVKRITEHRRFKGTLFATPFIAIRRTSRPNDRHRATGTLIAGKRPVAVENHLIVCSPRNRTIKSCRRLLKQLKSKEIDAWLNDRIRCRHLTVASIREIPINDEV